MTERTVDDPVEATTPNHTNQNDTSKEEQIPRFLKSPLCRDDKVLNGKVLSKRSMTKRFRNKPAEKHQNLMNGVT
jgi:hypothetical protein